MGRKRKHSDSTDVVAPSSGDKSPVADGSDRSSSKATGAADTSAQAPNDIVCSSLLLDQGAATPGGAAVEKVPLQRNAANERERARMRVLSKAFARLKTSLPWVPADTKLSKLDTLRLASCYIAHLSQLLAEDSDDQQASPSVHGGGGGSGNNNSATISSSTTAAAAITGTNIHPLNLTWPFTFSSRNSSSVGAISSSSSSSVETSRTATRTNTNHPTKYTALDKAEVSSA